MKLSHPFPRMQAEAKSRVQELLDFGCTCGGEAASLRQRKISAAVTVHLQCDGCGRSMSGGMKRSEHWTFQSYPIWNQELAERVHRQGQGEFEQRRAEFAAEAQKRSEAYRTKWLSDPAWRAMRQKVLERDGSWCQACLRVSATDVHHKSYDRGLLPPAFDLVAVCRPCHDRLHNWRASDPDHHDLRNLSEE